MIDYKAPVQPDRPDDILHIVEPLRCPRCGLTLDRDPWWTSFHWICPEYHTYSNVRVLIAELRERGWLPGQQPREGQDDGRSLPTLVAIGPAEAHDVEEDAVPAPARLRLAR